MDEEIILPCGINGTRRLAGALATLLLRRRGELNKYLPWGERIRRPWGSDELRRAKQLRAEGKTFAEIGAVVRRTKQSVHTKIGAA